MTTIAHLLEDFSMLERSDGPARMMSESALEDHRLSGFEQGYTAGWEDAIKAHTDDQTRISSALTRNLEDFSFTYVEAHNQILRSIEPIFACLIDKALPELLRQTLGHHILDQMMDMARDQSAETAEVVVAPGVSHGLRPLLDRGFPVRVELCEDPLLGPDEVLIRLGQNERQIDGARMLRTIQAAVDGFFHETNKESRNG